MSNYVPPTTPIGGPTGQQFPPQQQFPPPPQKKSNVLTWILVGCGTLVILGVIAVFLGGYFVWNKAKQAGLDPALMEKKPALAVAKMMVAANPDVELVSTDDEKGLITVRDKKSGKLLTVNLDEAQSGKITFKGEDGQDVTLEAKGDGEKGSLEVKTPDHDVIYKVGQYPSKPDWMSQKQWESYIDWESKQVDQQRAPARSVQSKIRKLLSNVLGRNQVREVTVVEGEGAKTLTQGWIAIVDVYSDESRDHAQERAVTAYVLVLNAGLNINRVLVSVYLRQEQKHLMDHALYALQADRGERPIVLQDFTPLR